MAQEILYTTTSDGVSIAYTTMGTGPALVFVNDMPFSNLQYEFFSASTLQDDEAWNRFLERRSVVRFDPRGMGMSERTISRFGLDEWVLDIEAVVDRLSLSTFALVGTTAGGPVAIAYAARHPERVTHLILANTFARPADSYRTPRAQILAQMLTQDFEMFSENAGAVAFGWGDERGRNFGEFIRQAVTPETARHVFGALSRIDVSDVLGSIQAPTLVIFNSGLQKYLTMAMSQELAARIPNARLVTRAGMLTDRIWWFSVTLPFLEEHEQSSATPDPKPTRREALASGTAIILFADIVDSTALTERLGDAAFRAKARDLDGALRKVIGEAGGTTVEGKLLGDGVLAVFSSARQAIEAALKCGAAGEQGGLPLHLGIHAGDVIEEDGNVFGGAVNIAARIAGESAPGEVLVSGTVRELARTSAGVAFEDAGEREMKGVGEEVRVWAVRAGEA